MPMTSLNQGFELDTIQQNPGHDLDKALFENVVPGEIPTLKSDVVADGFVPKKDELDTIKEPSHSDHGGSFATTLEALSSTFDLLDGRYDDIEYLRQDIFTSRGMNQRLAMECEELIPGFLSEQRPIGFFTQLTTQTQYTVSLEFLADTKETVMAAVMAALHELVERVMSWYKDFQKERDSREATIAARRMYFIQQNAQDVAQILNDQFKLFHTQDYDSQLTGRLGQVKEGSEDWFQLHIVRMRERAFNFKTWIERRPGILMMFNEEDAFKLLAGHIAQADSLQNQLVGMINSNAEGRVGALLDGDEFKRLTSFINSFHHSLLGEANHELEHFQLVDVIKMITSMFPLLVSIQNTLDDRVATMDRLAKAVERAKADFVATNHNDSGLTKLKNAQLMLAKLAGFERKFEGAMRGLTSAVTQSVIDYKRTLDNLLEKAKSASGDTATLTDVLDYKLVERIAQKLAAIE